MTHSREPIDGLRDLEAAHTKGHHSSSNDRMADLALMQALKGMTDALERVADRQDKHDEKLGEAVEAIHGIDKRLAVVESNSWVHRVDKLETRLEQMEGEHHARINDLEKDRAHRTGAISTLSTLYNSPTLAWLAVVISGGVLWVIQHKP